MTISHLARQDSGILFIVAYTVDHRRIYMYIIPTRCLRYQILRLQNPINCWSRKRPESYQAGELRLNIHAELVAESSHFEEDPYGIIKLPSTLHLQRLTSPFFRNVLTGT